jgi:hypothetical protein
MWQDSQDMANENEPAAAQPAVSFSFVISTPAEFQVQVSSISAAQQVHFHLSYQPPPSLPYKLQRPAQPAGMSIWRPAIPPRFRVGKCKPVSKDIPTTSKTYNLLIPIVIF